MFVTKQHFHKEIQHDGKSSNSSENLERNINSVLPNEIFIQFILRHLDLEGLHNASQTCKKWNNLVHTYFETNGNLF